MIEIIDKLYYEMSLSELKQMNANQIYPNVSYNSLLYLTIIDYKKQCTVSELASLLQVSKPAVTIKVNELLKQGYILKTQSEKDRRIFYLSLNPDINEEFRVFDKILLDAIRRVEEQFSKEEIQTTIKVLQAMADYGFKQEK